MEYNLNLNIIIKTERSKVAKVNINNTVLNPVLPMALSMLLKISSKQKMVSQDIVLQDSNDVIVKAYVLVKGICVVQT